MALDMKKLIAVLALSIATFAASAAEPTDPSIEKLLTLTKAESLMDSLYANMEQSMRQGMLQATAGKPLTDEQRRVMESVAKKFAQVVREELSWANLKPMYIMIYKESFDQEDVDGLIAFYSSKAGEAYVNKMPGAMQKSMAFVQGRMKPLLGKMAEAMKAATAEAKLAN